MAVEVAPVESQLRLAGREDRLVPGEPSVEAWGGLVSHRWGLGAGLGARPRRVRAHLTKHAPKSAALCPCGWASVGTTKAASLPKDSHSSRMSATHWFGLGLGSGLGLTRLVLDA